MVKGVAAAAFFVSIVLVAMYFGTDSRLSPLKESVRERNQLLDDFEVQLEKMDVLIDEWDEKVANIKNSLEE